MEPTNQDILKEIRTVQTTLQDYGSRLTNLETWRVSENAARSAVESYKKEHEISEERKRKRQLITTIGSFLGAATILIYAFLQYLTSRR